jgi:DDE superfamily endonuclease
VRAAEQDRPDVARKRRLWRAWQRFMDPARFIFLDETGTATNMARRYGRSPCGARLVAAVPQGHWQTTTFIAGLRQGGIVAPLVLDGPMTGPAFRAYIEQFLAPALAPGDVVVLDNLAAHKVKGVRQAIVAAGASVLYLPPIRLTSIRSSSCSPSSRRSCARPRRAPSMSSGRPSAVSSPPCRRANAPTASTTAAMVLPKMKVL